MVQQTIGIRTGLRPSRRRLLVLVFAVVAALVGLLLLLVDTLMALGGLLVAGGAAFLGSVAGRRVERAHAVTRMHAALEGLGSVALLVDGMGRIEFANRSADAVFGSLGQPLVGRRLDAAPWIGHEAREHMASLIGRAGFGESVRGDASLIGPTGQRTDLEIWLRPIPTGPRSSSIIVSAVDVTERRQGEDVQIALMQELDHRMKNTLHMVQAMIRRTARSHRDVETFERALVGRIQAFARTHEILAQERWLGAPLRTVVSEAIRVATGDEECERRIDLDGPRLWLAPRATLTLGLVFHELAVNAELHGALADPYGRVNVAWRIEKRSEPLLVVDWRESRPASTPLVDKRGFGMMYIERGVKHELDGEAELTFGDLGVHCVMNIPLSRVVERTVHGSGEQFESLVGEGVAA